MKLLVVITTLILMASCTYFINSIDNNSHDVINVDGEGISIVYSGNINGETHPCGCRHFPLGGLPNIAAQMGEIQKNNKMIYVDAGDTFFPSSTLPVVMKDSLSFAATNLAKALGDLGLEYFVPGDQDFAAGYEFLKKILLDNNIKVLAANLKKEDSFPHKKWIVIKKGPHKIFMTGLVENAVIPTQFRYLFTDTGEAFKSVLAEMKKEGYKSTDPFSRLIVVSNAGIEPDKEFATRYPEIDWFIGAHSQSFTTKPVEKGNTRFVQVLSRNHYLGEIQINVAKDKKSDSYKMHEMREEVGKKLKPNPWYAFIDKHKETLSRIQQEEQNKMTVVSDENARINTAASCIECHAPQAKKWHQTAHSNAYITLVKAKEGSNLKCISCHSVGLGKKGGFQVAREMVRFEEDSKPKLDSYLSELKTTFKGVKSIRKLSSTAQEKLSKKWLALDDKHGVTHNYMNVQCMNCHDKHVDHPFGPKPTEYTAEQKYQKMKNKCLSCHDADQSPDWYREDDRGLRTRIDEAKVIKMMKEVGCPKAPL